MTSFRPLRLDLDEVCGYFRRTMDAHSQQQDKLDDRLQPVEPEDFGSAVRSSRDEIQKYENIGKNLLSITARMGRADHQKLGIVRSWLVLPIFCPLY